jgi:5-methylcytosine-specific restriction endonuclease McrA
MARRIRRTALDRLWSEVVRKRDNYTCQRCGKKYVPPARGLDAAHIISRAYRGMVRYDLSNGVALCVGCHFYFDTHKDEFDLWVDQRWPGLREHLLRMAKAERKVDKDVVRAKLIAIRDALKVES